MSNNLSSSILKTLNLLANIILVKSDNIDNFLKKLISIIKEIVPIDSCFVYLHDQDKKLLILVGSKKNHRKEIGKIIMKEGEGITGWVSEHKKTVVITKEAYKDRRFKPFKELPEDKYESFLSIPIIDENNIVIGVINLQNRLPYKFSYTQIKTIESLVKTIAAAFKKIIMDRKINQLESKIEERKLIEKAKGILMKEKSITESEAFGILRKEAMNKRKSIKEIAEAVLLIF
jgi:uroporphyrinogen-III synthase